MERGGKGRNRSGSAEGACACGEGAWLRCLSVKISVLREENVYCLAGAKLA
jgi:hypothetical protein